MKKQKTVSVSYCDECGKETYGDKCLKCGKDWCYYCGEKGLCIEYSHAVYFQGSGDGHYCATCDAQLKRSGKDKLHSAYVAIAALQGEYQLWSAAFKKRTETAEQALKKLMP